MEKVVNKLTKKNCAISFWSYKRFALFYIVLLTLPSDIYIYSIASTFVDYVSKWV